MAKAKLVLDQEHRYWLEGVEQELTGCTTALKSVGLIDAKHYTDEGLERGNWVHDRLEEILRGSEQTNGICDRCDGAGIIERTGSDNMDISEEGCDYCGGTGDLPVDGREGYVNAGLRFIHENKVEVLHVEQPFADPTRMMAGKPDVIGLWTPPDAGERFVIADWKTGGPERWHRYQSAWYEHLARENKRVEGLCDRVMVHLKADGTYVMRRYNDRTDWKVADAVRLVEQAKKAA